VERDDIIRIAREAGLDPDLWNYTDAFERYAYLVAAHEREACAKWADLVAREMDNTNNTATYIASGIRSRREK
jgi:hypothetical protein